MNPCHPGYIAAHQRAFQELRRRQMSVAVPSAAHEPPAGATAGAALTVIQERGVMLSPIPDRVVADLHAVAADQLIWIRVRRAPGANQKQIRPGPRALILATDGESSGLLLRDAAYLSLRALRALLDLDAARPAWSYGTTHTSGYLRFVRAARAAVAAGGRVQIFWSSEPLDAEGWTREFRNALDRRITLKGGAPKRWRRLDPDYQTELMRDQQAYRRHVLHRVRLHPFQTDIARRRFGHLLDDDR